MLIILNFVLFSENGGNNSERSLLDAIHERKQRTSENQEATDVDHLEEVCFEIFLKCSYVSYFENFTALSFLFRCS